MVLDIHAHTALTGLFVYGNSYDDVYRYERHIVFPKILAQNCEDFNATNTIYNADCKKSGSVRRHMTSYLSHEVNTYTLEVSLLGFEDKEKRQIIPYTDELYARVGRNISRAMWDYYKIVGTIPLEDSSDEESGIPKPVVKQNVFKNFNMDRLKEVERQRQETAQTFDDEKDSVSVKPKVSIATASSKPMSRKKKDFVRLNSEKFRKSLSFDLDDLDGISNISAKNDNSSSGDNDYSDASGGKNSDKILTPIVSLDMDDNAYHSYMKSERQHIADLDDDVDFFFNPSSQNVTSIKTRSIQRQNSVDGFGHFRTNSQRALAGKSSSSTKQYFSSPLASLQISKLGAPDDTDLLAQTLGKSSLGLDTIQHSGFTSEC